MKKKTVQTNIWEEGVEGRATQLLHKVTKVHPHRRSSTSALAANMVVFFTSRESAVFRSCPALPSKPAVRKEAPLTCSFDRRASTTGWWRYREIANAELHSLPTKRGARLGATSSPPLPSATCATPWNSSTATRASVSMTSLIMGHSWRFSGRMTRSLRWEVRLTVASSRS